MSGLPKRHPLEIVSELREKARDVLADIQSGQPGVLLELGLGLTLGDMLETEAADCIEDLLSRVNRRR
jgi:hypothetical protein